MERVGVFRKRVRWGFLDIFRWPKCVISISIRLLESSRSCSSPPRWKNIIVTALSYYRNKIILDWRVNNLSLELEQNVIWGGNIFSLISDKHVPGVREYWFNKGVPQLVVQMGRQIPSGLACFSVHLRAFSCILSKAIFPLLTPLFFHGDWSLAYIWEADGQ